MSVDLGDLLAAPSPRHPGGCCGIRRIQRDLPADQLPTLEAALDSRLGHRELSDRLRARGVAVSNQTIGRHRNHACCCYSHHGQGVAA